MSEATVDLKLVLPNGPVFPKKLAANMISQWLATHKHPCEFSTAPDGYYLAGYKFLQPNSTTNGKLLEFAFPFDARLLAILDQHSVLLDPGEIPRHLRSTINKHEILLQMSKDELQTRADGHVEPDIEVKPVPRGHAAYEQGRGHGAYLVRDVPRNHVRNVLRCIRFIF